MDLLIGFQSRFGFSQCFAGSVQFFACLCIELSVCIIIANLYQQTLGGFDHSGSRASIVHDKDISV